MKSNNTLAYWRGLVSYDWVSQVVEDLRDSNESEKCHAFFVRMFYLHSAHQKHLLKPMCRMGYNTVKENEKINFNH